MNKFFRELSFAVARVISKNSPLRLRHSIALFFFVFAFFIVSILQELSYKYIGKNYHPVRNMVEYFSPPSEKSNKEILVNSAVTKYRYTSAAECLEDANAVLQISGYEVSPLRGSNSINGKNTKVGDSVSIRCYDDMSNKTLGIIIAADQSPTYQNTGNTVNLVRNKLSDFAAKRSGASTELNFSQLNISEPFHGYQIGVFSGARGDCKGAALQAMQSEGLKSQIDEGGNVYGMKPFLRASIYCADVSKEASLAFIFLSAVYDENDNMYNISSIKNSLYRTMDLKSLEDFIDIQGGEN